MENDPFRPNYDILKTPDNNSETDKKKREKSKKKGYEALLPQNREAEAQKIREALGKSPLFGEAKPEKPEPKHLSNPEIADDTEAPLDDLSEHEQQEVVQELANERKSEVEAELAHAEPDSPEAEEAADVIAMLERVEQTGLLEAADVEAEELEATSKKPQAAELQDFQEESEIFLAAREEEPEDTTFGASSSTGTSKTSAGFSGGGGTSPPRFGSRPTSPNVASDPNTIPIEDALYYERQAQNRGLLVGGIIGYLIGRRRGRIKTERRLAKVQQKLEKKVENVQTQLLQKETIIRHLARERTPQQRHHAERQMPLPRTAQEAGFAEKPISRLGLEKPARIERLGKAVIGAEAPSGVKPELRAITPEHVKAMNRNELLLLSEKVIVEGASLRQVYEQHLVGERGLRRLLGEYLKGKDIRKDLHKELLEREIDFERDPILRDKAYAEISGATATTSLQQLLEKVGATVSTDDDLLPLAKLQAAAKTKALQRQKRRRRVADTAMVTLVVVLAAAVVILLMRR
ncbi:MAG TPA: hypothetical protein VLG13_01505 [Patescibacteria group bacterium]|nr:hypothetical protein [Patescibacteria group bacterium]